MIPRPVLKSLPHVGRAAEWAALSEWLTTVAAGRGGMYFITGPSGIGKTRLASAVAERAARDTWGVANGCVYSVETGVPYAVWSDALLNLLGDLDAGARLTLTRGGGWLGAICPALATEAAAPESDLQRDGKARLLWNCAQLLVRMSEKRPLLLVLDNLQLADGASLELLHFIARQIGRARLGIIGTYADDEPERNPALRDLEQSLLALGAARTVRLGALGQGDVEQIVRGVLGAEHAAARRLAGRLYSWTRGHPFFVEETLKSLVDAGRLFERDGQWHGWDVEELDLPKSVRSSVGARLDRLGENARAVAGVAAVIGAHVRFGVLRDASQLENVAVLAAVDELRGAGILVESSAGEPGDYQFAHPIFQNVIYDALGVARARLLHATVAQVLESTFGGNALAHADVLAFHFSRGDSAQESVKAGLYLSAAGRDALARHADRAAADYLSAALERGPADADADSLTEDLAQARQRLGEYDAAMDLWRRVLQHAEVRGNYHGCARMERRMGLACYWTGRFEEALSHFDAALVAVDKADVV